MYTEIKIEVIDDRSPHLEKVIALGRSNAKTLGHMPRGGFLDYAYKQQIFVALSPNEECVGYLLYGVCEQIATIYHLCVDKDWRRKNIAKHLLSNIIAETKHLYAIKLSCRRDYNIDNIWSSHEFKPIGEKIGKNKQGLPVTIWVLNHKQPDLLTIINNLSISSKPLAVLDANVFFDLDKDNTLRQIEDSEALLADWLQSEVELCLTDEIHVEINRHQDPKVRQRLRNFASYFRFLQNNQEEFQIVYKSLRKYFPDELTDNDESDLKHLAKTITGKANFFITRDGGILAKEEIVYDKYNISVFRPSDLIIQLDQIRREADYQPVRLSGTSFSKCLIKSGQQDMLIDKFLCRNKGEKRVEFQKKIRESVVQTNKFECFVIWDEQKDPLALIVYNRNMVHELEISLLRVKKDYNLSFTILRHLLLFSIKTSAKENRMFTRIADDFLEDFTIRALIKDNFINSGKNWIRANISFIGTVYQVSNYLNNIIRNLGEQYHYCLDFINVLNKPNIAEDVTLISEIERNLYPLKIIDAETPNFIIPIKPKWAENLFDEGLANQGIFGADKNIALQREVVYYRSIKNQGGLKAPGRILWYVSQDNNRKTYCEVKAIRACSRLDEIIIDTPKNLFRQFRRLGVYKFDNLVKMVNNDLNTKIMALRFSDTELFTSPIPLEEIRKIINKKDPLASPRKISAKAFEELYNRGIKNTNSEN